MSVATVLIFTAADLDGRALFRALRLELSIQPGRGRLWVDLGRDNGYTPAWQQHLRHLQTVGRRAFDLPWDTTDLCISPRGKGVTLDGRSASLPLFLAWTALLAGRPLPEPFFAAGVALEDGRLVPAPLDKLQGKLEVADTLVRQTRPSQRSPVPMWVPEGSSYDRDRLSLIDVREVPTLVEAARQVLELEPRADLEATRQAGLEPRADVEAARQVALEPGSGAPSVKDAR